MKTKFKKKENKNYIITTTIFAIIMIFLIIFFAMEKPVNKNDTINKNTSISKLAKIKCIELCKSEVNKNVDLSNGPCLSDNNPEWDIQGWVCDVAHNPREVVDNEPKNQCKTFLEGKATHFVEVTPNCEFIRVH